MYSFVLNIHETYIGGITFREKYLVLRAGLAGRPRKAGLVGNVIFVGRACCAYLARRIHNSRATDEQELVN